MKKLVSNFASYTFENSPYQSIWIFGMHEKVEIRFILEKEGLDNIASQLELYKKINFSVKNQNELLLTLENVNNEEIDKLFHVLMSIDKRIETFKAGIKKQLGIETPEIMKQKILWLCKNDKIQEAVTQVLLAQERGYFDVVYTAANYFLKEDQDEDFLTIYSRAPFQSQHANELKKMLTNKLNLQSTLLLQNDSKIKFLTKKVESQANVLVQKNNEIGKLKEQLSQASKQEGSHYYSFSYLYATWQTMSSYMFPARFFYQPHFTQESEKNTNYSAYKNYKK